MKSISFDQIKTMLKSMSYSIFTRLRIVEKDIEGIRGKLPTTTEIIFTKGEDGNYTCNIPHTELWEMDADAIGRNARIIDGDKIYGVRGASKNTENLYGNVIQVYADLNVGSYDIPGTPPRTLILTYCIPEIVGTQMIYSEETSGLSNFPRSNIQSRVNIPVLYNGIWRNRYAEFMEENSLTGNMELTTMSPTVKGGAKVGKGLKMDGDALTVDEGEYELIEKIIIGYELLTAKPADWETNWTAYYKNTGTANNPTYTLLTGTTAPTWVNNTYYVYTGESAKLKRYYPDDESYRFKALKVLFQTSGATGAAGFSYFKHNSTVIANMWHSAKTTTTTQYAMDEITVDNGYWKTRWTTWNNTGDTYMLEYSNYRQFDYPLTNYPYVNHIDIIQTLAAKTTIEIWGVRA